MDAVDAVSYAIFIITNPVLACFALFLNYSVIYRLRLHSSYFFAKFVIAVCAAYFIRGPAITKRSMQLFVS